MSTFNSLAQRIWFWGLMSVILLGVAFYFVLGRGAKVFVTDQLLKREQTLTRAEASNITSFFQVFGDSVATLSQLSSMGSRNQSTIDDMDAFVTQWGSSGLVGGVVLTDKAGMVRFNSNLTGTTGVGTMLSDRDYFLWAKDEKPVAGEFYVGKAVVSRLGATKGKVIVPVASPVYENGIFTGVIVSPIVLQPLTERYLGMLKVSDMTDVYLIGKDGDLLFDSTKEGEVGTNIFETKHPFLSNQTINGSVKTALSASGEGKFQVGDRLAAYAPIGLSGRNWVLIMTSPVEKVKEVAKPLYIRQVGVLLLVSLAFLLFGLVAAEKIKF